MIRTRTRNVFFAAACCAVLTGCGPGSPVASNTVPPPDAGVTATGATPTDTPATEAPPTAAAAGGGDLVACGLITEQDASTAIGSPAGPGTPGGGPALSECIFDDGALIISMKNPGKDVYDTSRAKLPAGRFTDVPGVGDGAFETGGGGKSPLITMEFYKGTALVSILLTPDPGAAPDSIVTLAKVAASHL